jgi:hypothetical protein
VWAPHVSGSERERNGRGGPNGPEVGWAAGLGRVGRLDWFFFLFFFLFFSNPFQTNFKPFKFKSFTSFQIEILTQIYSTILRLLENLLNNFSNIKFKLSSFFLFKLLHQFSQLYFFETFKITPQPKLMHFNMMHKHLGDSNLNDV